MVNLIRYCVIISLVLMVSAIASLGQQDGSFVDPMKPQFWSSPVKKKPKESVRVDTSSWHLGAVLISVERSVAVINGHPLMLGEHIDGYKVTEIGADRVLLNKGGSKVVLKRAGAGLVKKNHQ